MHEFIAIHGHFLKRQHGDENKKGLPKYGKGLSE